MQKLLKIPAYFLLVAAAIGVLLRFQLLQPTPGLVFSYWLHAHSHLMFLGWLFNFFNLAFVFVFVPDDWNSRFRNLFIINQALIIGMMVFFPMQGYGFITIPLSTAHTFVSILFGYHFIKATRGCTASISRFTAMWSFVFFAVSALGPFALGPLMANGLGHSKWYYYAIYFYLHFQYNGVFFFAVLALFLKQLESKSISFESHAINNGVKLLILGTWITYLLSTLWSRPGLVYNGAGFVGSLVQLIGFGILAGKLLKTMRAHSGRFKPMTRLLLVLVATSFSLKFLLQVGSAHPAVAQLAYDNRYFIIAYLHLVLIGGITFYVLSWYYEEEIVKKENKIFVMFLIGGFFGSEVTMILVPSVSAVASIASLLIFLFSLIMFFGMAGFFMKLLRSY